MISSEHTILNAPGQDWRSMFNMLEIFWEYYNVKLHFLFSKYFIVIDTRKRSFSTITKLPKLFYGSLFVLKRKYNLWVTK